MGRSFYEPLFPPAQVTLGWNSFAAQWLSRVPALIPGHFHELLASGAVRDAFKAQAAVDWRSFLALRGSRGPDPVWQAYVAHRDKRRLALGRARFFRVTLAPTLAAALDPARPGPERLAFSDMLEELLARRLEQVEPAEIPQTLATMVLVRPAL